MTLQTGREDRGQSDNGLSGSRDSGGVNVGGEELERRTRGQASQCWLPLCLIRTLWSNIKSSTNSETLGHDTLLQFSLQP